MIRRGMTSLALAGTVLLGIAVPAVMADTTGPPDNAFGTITITIGPTAKLQARLIAHLSVTITCALPAGALSVDNTFDFLRLFEAVGNTVANGEGQTPNATFVCDGQPHAYMVDAGPPNVPFKKGEAVAQMTATNCGTLADYTFACTTVLTPWVTVKLK